MTRIQNEYFMKREQLLGLLGSYKTTDAHEAKMQQKIIDFVMANEDCFERSHLAGHITGSAWILDEMGSRVLLIHHVKLDKWLQPGGHADGETDILKVAMKEALEETGLELAPLSSEIFDVDIHTIPTRKEVPEHLHYDIRFAFKCRDSSGSFAANREVKSARWIGLDEVAKYNSDISVMRMVEKSMGS